MSAYEVVWFRGRRFDRMTAQALLKMEDRLGYQLTVLQGSYNGGVGASAGTHDGGGAVDLAAADAAAKVRVGREVGFAMWERRTLPGVWPHHVHGILIGNTKAAPAARRQVAAYRAGRDGLAGNGPDTGPRPAVIREFKYTPPAVVPRWGVSLLNLRVDFINAADGHAGNAAAWRVKVVQRRLRGKGCDPGPVDGVVGDRTLNAWGQWEARVGRAGRPRVPDKESLTRLLRGSAYFVVG